MREAEQKKQNKVEIFEVKLFIQQATNILTDLPKCLLVFSHVFIPTNKALHKEQL